MHKILGVVLTLGLALTLQAQTSEDNPRLAEALERFPEADMNKDGVLTAAEARAFKEKRQGQRNQKEAKAVPLTAKAPEGGDRRIYKKAGDVELPLYIFYPAKHKADTKTPAIVFFFGGGWKSGSPAQFEQHCKYLAERGMVAITAEYRVSSRHGVKVEKCIEDAKSAMRWVRAHAAELGIDPDCIAAGGGSAGGHLAACTAVIDDFDAASDPPNVSAKPNALVLFNPVLGLPPDDPRRQNPANTSRTSGPTEKAFPLTYASKKQAPCIMFFGTKDNLLAGANLYRQKSIEAGNNCTIVTYEGQKHAFFNYKNSGGKYYNLTLAETDKFLVERGWLSRDAGSKAADRTKSD